MIRNLLFLVMALILFSGCKEKKTPPNIIFIMSDDHAYQAISAYNDDLIQTPHIDRIADQGMLFTNACVTNSICAPSRAVILTGKHSHINGKIDNRFPFDTSNITFPQILQENGYQTALFGKLHFGNEPKGFDQYKILIGQGNYYNPDFIIKDRGKVRLEGYTTDLITDMTMDWMKEERDPEKPYMMMYLHKAPHREWLPPPRHFRKYTEMTFPEPETLFDDYEGRGEAARSAEMNLLAHMNWAGDSKIKPENMDILGIPETVVWDKGAYEREVGRMNPDQRALWDEVYDPINETFVDNYASMSQEDLMRWRYQRYMQDYLGSVAAVDDGVGRLLDYLEEENMMENTIIVYTSDQGFYLGEHGWFDKRFVYDESFKTPLIVRWDGVIKPGSKNSQMVQNLDFAQTFLDAAGMKAPEDMQGVSLVPLFRGEEEGFRDAVYYHYYEYPAVHMVKRHYAIVTEEYKLAHFYDDIDEWELYDRKKDIQEMKNVIDDPGYASVVEDLKKKLAEMRKAYKDSPALDQAYIDLYKN